MILLGPSLAYCVSVGCVNYEIVLDGWQEEIVVDLQIVLCQVGI